jgi:hypothetical protein
MGPDLRAATRTQAHSLSVYSVCWFSCWFMKLYTAYCERKSTMWRLAALLCVSTLLASGHCALIGVFGAGRRGLGSETFASSQPCRRRHGVAIAQGDATLLRAARQGDDKVVAEQLEAGDPRERGMALHIASSLGHVGVVRTLLDAGVDPQTVEKGVTSLHTAAFKNRTEVVDLLLAAGADPNAAQESDGSTALLEAAVAGHATVVQKLLASGADPDLGVSSKPLPSAAIKNQVAVVELLLAAGADPNTAEDDGSTALLKAAATGHTRIVNMLSA